MSTDPDTFPPEVVAAIRDHLNRDHPQDCLLLARGPGACPEATEAMVTGLDRSGLDLQARVGGRDEHLRISWSRRLAERREVREELTRMVMDLRERKAR